MKPPLLKFGPLDSDYETEISEDDVMNWNTDPNPKWNYRRIDPDLTRTIILFLAVALVWIAIVMVT